MIWPDYLTETSQQVAIAHTALVDGEQYHTVNCSQSASVWLRDSCPEAYEHTGLEGWFDVNDEVLTMLLLKFR